jgi:hypothetical protein
MKNLMTMVAILAVSLMTMPVYAAESAAGEKPMTLVQFMRHPDHKGLNNKVVIKKYGEYRSLILTAPQATLEKSKIRWDERRRPGKKF